MPPILSALLAFAPLLAQETTSVDFRYPSGKAGRVAAAWFAAYHDSADEGMTAFLRQYRTAAALQQEPVASRLERHHEIRRLLGDLRPHSVLAQTDLSVAILANSSSMSAWFSVGFDVDEAGKLATLSFRPGAAPAGAVLIDDDWQDVAGLAEIVCDSSGLPALAAAVVRGGEIVATGAYGVRDADGDDPARVEDRFHVGSIAKSMTATLVGRLVEQGVLAWDTSLGTALRDVTMCEEYRAITLAQLLQHRSGLPAYSTDDPMVEAAVGAAEGAVAQRAAFVAAILQQPPTFAAGTKMAYSNAGYALAGHLAERAAGKPFEDLLREHVFEPLGMARSGFGWPRSEARPDQPLGHLGTLRDPAPQQPGEYELGAHMAPVGDVHCCVADLAAFARAHLRGLQGVDGVLEAATIRAMHAAPVDGPTGVMAMGWVVDRPADGDEVHWQAGSAGTFYALVRLLPEQGVAVVVLANAGLAAHGPANSVADALVKRFGTVR